MIGWILLALLALLVLLACCLRMRVSAGYDEGGGWVKLWVGPKGISLYPKPAPGEKKPRKKKKPKAPAKQWEKPTLGGALDLALDLLPEVKAAAGRFRRALWMDELYLHLVWGEPDPADAAIHYGRAWGAAEALLAFLRANFTVKRHQVQVDLDYQLERPRLTARASLSLTVAQLLAVVLPLAWAALTTLWRHRKQSRAAAAPSAAHEGKGEENNGKESSCQ